MLASVGGLVVLVCYFLSLCVGCRRTGDERLNSLIAGLPSESGVNPDGFIMVVVFSPYDCSSCLQETVVWNRIRELFKGKLTIIGVVRSDNRRVMERFAELNDLRFFLLLDSTNTISEKFLGKDIVPQRFFFNNLNVVRVDKVNIQPESKEEEKLIEWIADELKAIQLR